MFDTLTLSRTPTFISSRVARYTPELPQQLREADSERRLEAIIEAQPHTRYVVYDTETGQEVVRAIKPAQLLDIWSDSVITAGDFVRRWNAAELLRLLTRWNQQRSRWRYLPAPEH